MPKFTYFEVKTVKIHIQVTNHLIPFGPQVELGIFRFYESAKNAETSNDHSSGSRKYFSSGKSSETFWNIILSHEPKSQHLLTFGQHIARIGHLT